MITRQNTDPHAANVLVRQHPKYPSKPQIVLLDHGLYRELDDTFRRDYCRLWQSLVLADRARIQYFCERLNAGHAYTLLAAMLTMKPWDDIVSDDMSRFVNMLLSKSFIDMSCPLRSKNSSNI